jgi:hypothetical protein
MQKQEIVKSLRESHSALAHDIAAQHGGELYDLSCNTPKCGQQIKHYFVQRNARRTDSPADDWSRHPCPKCLVIGSWKWVPSPKASDADLEAAKKIALAASEAKKAARIAEIDKQIELLSLEKAALLPPEPVEVEEPVSAAAPDVEKSEAASA